MSTPVKLPELGESVTEGTITRWLKQVGDTVEVDEPLLEVSTDKVDTEVPSPVAGKILEIKAEEDETVEVGAELCIVGDEGEDAGSDDSEESEDSKDSGEDAEDSADAEESEDSDEDDEDSGDDDSEEEGAGDEDTDSDDADEEEADEEPEQETGEEKPAAKKGGGGGGGGKPVKLPELGESVTEGTITRWLKSVGDEVEVDEPLVEVSTDKVDTEIPSPLAGTLLEIKAEEDETVEVGAELCMIGDASDAPDDSDDSDDSDTDDAEESEDADGSEESADEAEEEEPEAEPEAEDEEDEDEEPEPEPEPEPKKEEPKQESKSESDSGAKSAEGGTYVTPLVRKMAAEHGVDLDSIEGTGVGGRIRKQDVLAAAESGKSEEEPAAAGKQAGDAPAEKSPSPLRGKTEPMSRLRKVIAKRMVESLQNSAQLTQVFEVDVTNIARLRDSVKADFLAREGVKLSYLPFFAKAAVDALKSHPALNATFDLEAGEVTYHESENVAFAVDTEKGLLTPVVKDAGDLSIAGLAKKIADVAERTRTNKIGPDDLSGGTFTITNLGSVGALWDTPIINKPQVAILGPGAVVKRAVVIDDPNLGETIAVRHMVYLALTYDHQLVDGADAGRFLTDVKARLESGQFDV